MDSPAVDDPRAGGADAAATHRFAASLDRVWTGFAADPSLILGVAVSGGSDSLALLLLAAQVLPRRVRAATVDHGLRPESRDEAAFVAVVCARLGIDHAVLPVTVDPGNIQAQARAARYRALSGWMRQAPTAALATAHHADDQAETLLARLNRGSGVSGLAGVRATGRVPGSDQPLMRPLLDWRRRDLAAVVAAAGIDPVEDPGNSDTRFDRVRIRKALAAADWLDVPAIAASAAHLADADAALAWATEREWQERVRREGLGMVYRPGAPRAVALRVIARIAVALGEDPPRGRTVAGVFESLRSGSPAPIGALVARPGPEGWVFNPAPRRRNP